MTDTESLSSPSPSPPPSNSRRKADTIAKTAGLDSSSDLSELTEDEQDGLRDAAKTSTTQTINRSPGRRKRGGLVPAPMWDWAYKAPSKKIHEPDENPSAGPSRLPDGADPDETPTNDDSDAIKENGREKSKIDDSQTNHVDEDGGEPLDEDERESEGGDDADDNEEGEDDGDEESLSDAKETREGSLLTEVDDADDAAQEDDASVEDPTDADESAQSDDAEDDDDPTPAEQQNDTIDDIAQTNVAESKSVVPAAPSGSSIMAGQQIIKTPSPSPSPEPDEELPAAQATTTADLDPDPEVEQEVELDAADVDAAERADPDQDMEEAEVDNEVEGETEEAELDLQPAHRAEALDVLAGIELRFALLRERLYVEKMEDLAMEEAMILQGVHPEMTHLLNELQVRHDRRLELAAKKRRFEDEHVSLMRKVEEDGIWSWWKYERDQLQTDMFTESHRKRRRLEREKRGLERVMPIRRIPPPTTVHVPSKPLTVRDLVKFSSVDPHRTQSKLKRKRKEENGQILVYPSLTTLPLQEVQADLQIITARRTYMHQLGSEIGPGIGLLAPPPSAHEGYEYNPTLGPPTHPHFGGLPPQSTSIYAPPPTTRSIYHHPPPPQPVSVIHHQSPNPRIMQGPGQLQHLHSGPGTPLPMSGYLGHGPRPIRRTPSPPPMQNFDHGPANGVPPYATSGPGQHGWATGPGPTKRPVVNGWQKDPGRPPNGKDAAYEASVREREGKMERDRVRDREGWNHDGASGEIPDEQGRIHSHYGPHSHQVQQPHRHTLQHQSLQGVPHHHHVVHHHRQSHHHHSQNRIPSSSVPSQHGGPPVRHEIERHNPLPPEHENVRRNVIEHINVQPKPPPPPYWKTEEAEASARDRSRMMIGPNSAPPPPPPPPHDRLQPTPFLMTPSHLSQSYSSSSPRREPWPEDGPSRRPLPMETLSPSDAPQRHPSSHVTHQPRHVSSPQRHGLASPRRNGLPQGPPPSPPMSNIPSNNHIHSPGSRRHTHSGIPSAGGSAHTSPHVNSSTPKMSRPISPLPAPPVPVKSLPPLYPHGPPSGPGTPGAMGSRLGTPGLAGPGTRPDIPPNGHPGSIPLYASPAPPLSGPGQPHLSPPAPEPSHILPAPPKMSVVQMGNGT